ncbi:MAG: 30S ribosomal protein S13 [Candidatus Omnitrophica bacterium]|nr:30S ribosomal protein S13 [Candidatus Omnitrophota bacterium]
MPRIVGVEVPREKRVETALTYIYGIGRVLAAQIVSKANINPATRAKDLTGDEVSRLTGIIQKDYKVEGELRRDIAQNIKRLIDIGSYRGMRHRKGLPVRGQRTHTNARTRKGRRTRIGGVRAGGAPTVVKAASAAKAAPAPKTAPAKQAAAPPASKEK